MVDRWRPHIFVVFTLAALSLTGVLCTVHDKFSDWRSRLAPRAVTGEIALVAIDAPSIARLGVWPWQRTLHAELLSKLKAAGAAEVAFDVDFSSRSTVADDQAFARALEEFGGSAILPVFKQVAQDKDGAPHILVARPLPEFASHAWSAAVNVVPEPNGSVRRYSFGELMKDEFHPSMAALLAGAYAKTSRVFHLDQSIRVKGLPTFSFVDVLDGNIDTSRLKDKRVIIGATAIELGDRFHLPIGGIVSGVELQALAAETVLQARMLGTTGLFVSLAGLAALALLTIAALRRLGPARQTMVLIAVACVLEAAAALMQAKTSTIVDTSLWLAAIGSYVIALWLNELDFRRVVAKIAENRFQSVALSLGDGVVCVDPSGHITFWNPGAKAIYGYCAKEAIGQAFGMLYQEGSVFSPAQLCLRCDELGESVELRGVRKDGSIFSLEARLSSWQESNGTHYGAVVRDITSRKRAEKRIRYLALHDSLTGLANRTQLRDRMNESIGGASQSSGAMAVLLIDLDNFKEINDTLGHEQGDKFLCTFAEQLQACIDDDALVARLGGDEFVVFVEGTDAEARAKATAQSISEIFGDSYTFVDGSGFLISACSGSAIFPRDGSTVDELLASADLALHRAKILGRGAHVPYQRSFGEELEKRRLLEAELRRAAENGEFELHYQPQFRLRDARLVGVEALIRWRHPVRGLLLPGEFLDVLHSSNLSVAVGGWVLKMACEQGQ